MHDGQKDYWDIAISWRRPCLLCPECGGGAGRPGSGTLAQHGHCTALQSPVTTHGDTDLYSYISHYCNYVQFLQLIFFIFFPQTTCLIYSLDWDP